MTNPIDDTKKGLDIVVELVKAAGENPQVKEAGQNLGQAALTITKTINIALLPLAAVNFGYDKAKVYFSEKFQEDLLKKANSIPQESIIEPKPSIAGPVLQGLAFTHEEPNLKDMYLNLLVAAMDGRGSEKVHPAYVEIIKQLNSKEAGFLKVVLTYPSSLPIVEVRRNIPGQTVYNVLLKHLLNNCDEKTKEPVEDPLLPAMVDNWIRLGLAEVDYSKWLNDDNYYSWVTNRPEFKKLVVRNNNENKQVTFQRGILSKTAFGFQFAQAVGISQI